MTSDELFGRMVGYTALMVGWVYGSTPLIFAGTFVIMMELFSNWGDEQ